MTLQSFAQNFEDVLLWRALQSETPGRYVDVGAGHPQHHSVTKLFYDAGWSGINIEPLGTHAKALMAERPRDVNLQAVVSSSKKKSIDLTVVDDWDELSTTTPSRVADLTAEGRSLSTVAVPVVRLDEVLREHELRDIQFLKIDVEGAELDVLRTLDLKLTRPWVILLEVLSGSSPSSEREAIRAHLSANGYDRVYFDGLNDFYLANEQAERLNSSFETPVNVTDDFVAVSDGDRVLVDLIGAKVGLTPPASGSEVSERVEALLRDRVRFEETAVSLEGELRALNETLEAERLAHADIIEVEKLANAEAIEASQSALAEARKSLVALQLTLEAMEQTSFERERLVAWYAKELSQAKAHAWHLQAHHDRLEAEAQAEAAAIRGARGTQIRLAANLARVLWRATLPFRVLRRPRFYLRLLANR